MRVSGSWMKLLRSSGVGYMKFQTTNTSVLVWFWINSMLVFEVVLYCLDWLEWL